MSANIKLIEFVVTNDAKQDLIILMDVEDISYISQYDNTYCTLFLKSGHQYLAYGTHRTLTNRWVYCLERKKDFYQDYYIRPSMLVYHRPDLIAVDNIHFDKAQLKAFIQCLDPQLLLDKPWIFDNE